MIVAKYIFCRKKSFWVLLCECYHGNPSFISYMISRNPYNCYLTIKKCNANNWPDQKALDNNAKKALMSHTFEYYLYVEIWLSNDCNMQLNVNC